MVLASIRQLKQYPTFIPQIVPAPVDARIGMQCAVRLSSVNPTTYIARIIGFKTKQVFENGQWVNVEWANVDIPGLGTRWIPPTFFVVWAW